VGEEGKGVGGEVCEGVDGGEGRVGGGRQGVRRRRLRGGRSSYKMQSVELLRCGDSGAKLLPYALSNIGGVELGAMVHTILGV